MATCSVTSVDGKTAMFAQNDSGPAVSLFLVYQHSSLYTDCSLSIVMGYSDDGFPYVGAIHDKPGQYVCAGFSGHGMPQIFLSAKAIAQMVVSGATAEEAGLPLPYRTTPERWVQHHEHISVTAWRAVVGPQSTSAKL